MLERPFPTALTFLLGLLVAVATAPEASASGGYFAGTKGARAAGRGGAFVAKADDLSAAVSNPAGLAKLDAALLQVGNRFSYNALSYTRAPTLDYGNLQNGTAPLVSFQRVDNDRPYQLLDPLLGIASNLGLRNWAFAVLAYAPPGISREAFSMGGGQRYMMVSREAVILAYAASVAWRHDDTFGIGATLEWIHVPRLIYSLIIDGSPFPGDANPVSSELDMKATATGSDPFTFNAILGAWFRPVPRIELGVSGQIVPAEIVTNSTLSIQPVTPGIEGTVLLTRDGVPANDVTVHLPLPLLARAGARYRGLQDGRERFDIELDVEYETWSRVGRFRLETNGIQGNLGGQFINIGRIDIEKHWRDTVAVRLGGDYALLPEQCTLRAGLYYETAVADESYAHVDFPSGQQLGAALGTSLRLGKKMELAAAYELRLQPTVSVAEANARVYQEAPGSQCQAPYTDPITCNPNYLGQPSPAINAGRYQAQSHSISIDVLYRF